MKRFPIPLCCLVWDWGRCTGARGGALNLALVDQRRCTKLRACRKQCQCWVLRKVDCKEAFSLSTHELPHLRTNFVPRAADVLHLTRQSYLTVVVLTLAMPSSKLQHGICWELCCGLLKLVTRISLIVSTRGAMLASCRNV